jgi:hypothetical protein
MSEVFKSRKFRILLLAGCVMLFAGAEKISAAENILGDWVFTMEMPDAGGMGGSGMNITINSTFTKGADGAITGTWVMNFQMPEGMGPGPGGPGGPGPGGGMGGMQMPTFKIVDVKIDGQNLSFTRKAEGGDAGGMGGMMSADRKFTGTIKGDTIELKSTSDFGEMTYKGTRKAVGTATTTAAPTAAAATGLEGDWEFVTTVADMGFEMRANVTFKKDADGKYSATWEMAPMGGRGGFGGPREGGPGAGGFGGPREGGPGAGGFGGPREGGPGAGGPGGGFGGFQPPTIKIEDIKLDGEKLTFVQKFSMGDMGEMVSKFAGTLKGDKIEGTMTSDMGESKVVATRKKPEAAPTVAAAGGDPLVGNWELKMTMPDMGMGMGMEFNIKSAITKGADGKYAMTWEQTMTPPPGAEGMGGPGGGMGGGMPQPKVTISDIKLDGEKLTFTQKVSFGDMGGMGGPGGGGMEMTSKFTGTIKANVMEGKLAGEGGGDMGMPAMEFSVKGNRK